MDILVFVKQVPDDSVEIHLDGAGVPAVKDVEKVTNAFDTYALELATRYTEANGGEVTVAAIGTEDCTSMMKNLLAVGAKKAYLFKDDVFAGEMKVLLQHTLQRQLRNVRQRMDSPTA